MELVKIHECLCDRTRLRILNLLYTGPLCVCHLQEILGEPQVKISRHLNYLKTRDMVAVQREANWMIYSLPEKRSHAFATNLVCLQECASDDKLIQRDNSRLAKVRARLDKDDSMAAAICRAKTVGGGCCIGGACAR